MSSIRQETLTTMTRRLASGEIDRTTALELVRKESTNAPIDDELARRAAEFARKQLFEESQRC